MLVKQVLWIVIFLSIFYFSLCSIYIIIVILHYRFNFYNLYIIYMLLNNILLEV